MSVIDRTRQRVMGSLLPAGAALCCAALAAVYVRPARAQDAADDFKPMRVVQAFPPLTRFPIKSIRAARDSLSPAELVLGVTVGKESRAYPINMLTGPEREILNDTLGGRAIAATW
jgi:hypothetical protein